MNSIVFKRISLVLVVISGLFLIFYTSYRAYKIPITHDEAVTFRLLKERTYEDIIYYTIAEDHMLNTLLMKKIQQNFGNTEWKLRLPNLFGHCIYLIFSFLILWKFGPKNLILPAYLLLNFNPYLLDFFSCARGYGLSVAFMLPSIYFLLAYIKTFKPINLILTFVTAALSVLTIATLLNYYIIITGIIIALQVIWLLINPFKLERVITIVTGFAFVILFSYYFYDFLSFMLSRLSDKTFVKHNNFYNFYEGTIRTISFRSIYTKDSGHLVTIISYTIMFSYLIVFALLIRQIIKQKFKAFFEPFAIIFALGLGMTLSVSFQNLLFQIRFPSDRAALFFAPAFTLMIIFLLFHLSETPKLKLLSTILISLFAVLACYNMNRHANFKYYVDWKFDMSGKEMISDLQSIASKENKTIDLGAQWIFEPSANYYRATDGHTWLKEIIRDSLLIKQFDFYYLRASDTIGMNFKPTDVLKVYSGSETMLLQKHQ